jgi:hypothetical protein
MNSVPIGPHRPRDEVTGGSAEESQGMRFREAVRSPYSSYFPQCQA